METKIIKLNASGQEREQGFEKARLILKSDGVVGIPTETVYGLAARFDSEDGVKAIYEAKGRPSDNPLIVHIWPGADLKPLVSYVPPVAEKLMEAFWPGPLTMVFQKNPAVLSSVTGGLNTVAIRMPSHPDTRALLDYLKMPLVAPSANTSGYPSPTLAEHVYRDLNGRIELILDGGACGVGLESTVVDVSSCDEAHSDITILRPGFVTKEMLENVLGVGHVSFDPAVTAQGITDSKIVPKAPGMKYKHYSPRCEVTLMDVGVAGWQRYWLSLSQEEQEKTALMVSSEFKSQLQHLLGQNIKEENFIDLGSSENLAEVAENLFAALRLLDDKGFYKACAEMFDNAGLGTAIMNRLRKASAGRVYEE